MILEHVERIIDYATVYLALLYVSIKHSAKHCIKSQQKKEEL